MLHPTHQVRRKKNEEAVNSCLVGPRESQGAKCKGMVFVSEGDLPSSKEAETGSGHLQCAMAESSL